MKLHSRTEKVTFFLKELCEIFCKQWMLLGLMAIVWLSILAQTESSMFLVFFTGFHTALTIIIVSTMVYEAKLTAKLRHWYNVCVNNALARSTRWFCRPSVSHEHTYTRSHSRSRGSSDTRLLQYAWRRPAQAFSREKV